MLHTDRTDEFGELYQGFNAMLREVRVRDEKLSHLATTDPLTGLANRRFVLETMQTLAAQSERNQTPLGVILLDVDHFKQVNDTYGHDAGDQVLLSVAQALKKGVRKQDGLTARFGGDEFAILFREKDRQRCETVLADVKAAIDSQTHTLRICNETSCVHVSISCGLADVHTAADASSAIHLADLHLYEQKKSAHQND